MSTTKKVLIAIFSIIIIAAFAFLITWGIINFKKVKEGMSGTGLYTKEDVDKAYDDGYNTALTDKGDYETLINSYKETIALQTDAITKLDGEKSALDKSVQDCQTQVNTLTEQRDALQIQIDLLKEDIANLNETVDTKDSAIAEMVAEKQELIEQHTQTVARLNAQITTLNGTIEDLNTQIQINMSSVSQLNNKIAQLQRTIAFYEEFVGQFETEDQALVTFEFAGSVYEVKTVNKGDKVTVVNPESTEYLIFNGWTLDGEPLDLMTFTVMKNVRIVADVTYKYVVDFTVDGKTKSTQVVEKGNYATEPTSPRKNGYRFKFWTLDGETEAHLEQLPIMANTMFIAKFVELHKVDFLYENGDMIINTKSIEHGLTTSAPRMTLNEGEILNGWRVNGILVDIGSYVINADTTFVADITHRHKVTFMVDDVEYNVQFVENGRTVSVTAPVRDGYAFVGWKVRDTENVLDLASYPIVGDITFDAVFEKATSTVTFKSGENIVSMQQVSIGDYATAPTTPTKTDYDFTGWSVDGNNIVNIAEYAINSDVTFNAVFVAKYGLFKNRELVLSWDEMLANNYVTVSGNTVTKGSNNLRYALDGDIKIPDRFTTIDGAFNNFYNITSVEGYFTTIGDSAFYGCKKMTSCYSRTAIVSIGESAFYNCEKLLSVPFGWSVSGNVISTECKSIGSKAFYGCKSISSFVIGNGCTFTSNSFAYCTGLKNCYIALATFVIDWNNSSGDTYAKTQSPFWGCNSSLKACYAYNFVTNGYKFFNYVTDQSTCNWHGCSTYTDYVNYTKPSGSITI